MKRPTESRADFVANVAKELPREVPEAIRKRLAGKAFDLACAPTRPKGEESDLANEARAITAAAFDLTESVDKWHRKYGLGAIDLGGTEDELKALRFEDDAGLSDSEFRHAMAGADRLALRVVLLGLQVHLGRYAVELSKPGPDENWRAPALKRIVEQAFNSQSERAGPPRVLRRNSNKAGDWWAPSVRDEVINMLLGKVGSPSTAESIRKNERKKRARARAKLAGARPQVD